MFICFKPFTAMLVFACRLCCGICACRKPDWASVLQDEDKIKRKKLTRRRSSARQRLIKVIKTNYFRIRSVRYTQKKNLVTCIKTNPHRHAILLIHHWLAYARKCTRFRNSLPANGGILTSMCWQPTRNLVNLLACAGRFWCKPMPRICWSIFFWGERSNQKYYQNNSSIKLM